MCLCDTVTSCLPRQAWYFCWSLPISKEFTNSAICNCGSGCACALLWTPLQPSGHHKWDTMGPSAPAGPLQDMILTEWRWRGDLAGLRSILHFLVFPLECWSHLDLILLFQFFPLLPWMQRRALCMLSNHIPTESHPRPGWFLSVIPVSPPSYPSMPSQVQLLVHSSSARKHTHQHPYEMQTYGVSLIMFSSLIVASERKWSPY